MLEEQDTLQHPSYLPGLPHQGDFGRTCCHLGLGASYDHLPEQIVLREEKQQKMD